MNSVKSVDDYISQAPSDLQKRLRDIRETIKSVAPQSEEKISYGMPYYGYKGRLVYFAYAKNHIGLYIPPPVIKNHVKDLKSYTTAKSTVQFPHTEKLPLDLIKKLVKARMAINENK
jgi:uncharacterized protein YdhG (YjbR/CyaY superfamily)